MTIPIIDLFAGPGGLGEGFSSYNDSKRFKIALSIEKDQYAHQTLSLRSFVRQFLHESKDIPKEYYEYLNKEISKEDLFDKYPDEAKSAIQEAWLCELGSEKFPNSLIDEKIRKNLKGKKDCILIGGPPCQAYSLVGRARMMGGQRNAKDGDISQFETDHRHVLYRQYLRIIAEHEPKVFVMENVKGILSSKLNGKRIFPLLKADLETPYKAAKKYFNGKYNKHNYKIISFVTGEESKDKEFMIKCEDYGIPQARHRVILFGIREDVYDESKIKTLKKLEPVSVSNALAGIPLLRSGLSKRQDSIYNWKGILKSSVSKPWFKEVDKEIQKEIKSVLRDLKKFNLFRSSDEKYSLPEFHRDWFGDYNLKYLPNHDTRGHMDSDIHRYLFVSAYGKVKGESPRLKDFPKSLLPAHRNVNEAISGQKFADRFKVQLADKPSTTITSHISKDGHYFIHPDPAQCRSLTVREAARLQTFPDNYFFEGNRTQQYHQVGNAVPPLLARQLAEIVWNLIK